MKIKSIELINLKSHKRSLINLSESINLLLGENNSGKSTVIRSLLNLQYRAFDKKDIRSSESYSKIHINVIDVSTKDNESFRHKDYPRELEASKEYTVCWGMSRNGEGGHNEEPLYFNSKHKVTRLEYDRLKIVDNKGKEVNFKNFPRFPANENQNNFIYPFLAKRKTDYYDSTINGNEVFRVTDTFRNLAAKVQKISNPSHPKNAEFNLQCENILGFKIGVIPSDPNNNGLEVGIYTDPTSLISIRSMGDGVANILGFIVILLTEDNKLFLIEELENDIHPKALKLLLDLIIEKSHNNQFVISTHSHIVLKYLGISLKSKIFYIDWNSKSESGFDNIPTSQISEVENKPENRIAILEKLGYDFFDFELHESYLILEEASAERIIRDFLIPNIIPELYNKLKTIAAKGVNDLEIRVKDFHRLFVFIHTNPIYHKKAWVIADGDEAGTTAIENLQNQFKSWPKEHFINFDKKNFEYYYPTRFQKEVSKIFLINDRKKKQDEKIKLLHKVMDWALNNREEATKEFQISAKEVISILKLINSKLKKQSIIKAY